MWGWIWEKSEQHALLTQDLQFDLRRLELDLRVHQYESLRPRPHCGLKDRQKIEVS